MTDTGYWPVAGARMAAAWGTGKNAASETRFDPDCSVVRAIAVPPALGLA